MKPKPPEFTPHWGECLECAQPLWLTGPAKRYCDECKKRHKRKSYEYQNKRGPYVMSKREPREQKMARYLKQLEREELKERDRTRHVCKVTDTCIYGACGNNKWCNYAAIAGKCRSIGGKHRIKDGKCDLYTVGPHIITNQIEL